VRFLLSGGGTGGHVYPALAVVQELERAACGSARGHLDAVLYVGTVGGMEAGIVRQAGLAFSAVEAAGLRGMSVRRGLANALSLIRGCAQAWQIVRGFRPDVVMATGGYACAPVVIVSWLQRRPVLIYLPDIEPGLAVRQLSRLARRVAVSFQESLRFFPPGKGLVTGYPVRRQLYQVQAEEAKRRLGLDATLQTVLALGGSRGSHSINLAISQALEEILKKAQVVHIAGEVDADWLKERRDQLPADLRRRYVIHAYLHEEMLDALLAADLAVARAGAATMGEFAAASLPSILVPYPYAGQHQEANADFLVSRGAGRKVLDSQLGEGVLGPMIQDMLADENALRAMADCARRLARLDAAAAIAEQLSLLAGR
jgi:UDP-N-acetylglucosamine--N-acetylmuramyl-(pentapeptide) pyrophosphoryl-undecaprenol N-acetylglucosamine transferase